MVTSFNKRLYGKLDNSSKYIIQNKNVKSHNFKPIKEPKSFHEFLMIYHKIALRKKKYKPPATTTLENIVKCQSQDKNFHVVETSLITDFFVKTVKNDDLTTDEIIEFDQPKHEFMVSNCLFFKCPICLEIRKCCSILTCGHALCENCYAALTGDGDGLFNCPVCRKLPRDIYITL